MLRFLILFLFTTSTLLINAQQTSGRAVYEKSTAIKVNAQKGDPSMQRVLVNLPKSFDRRAELLFSEDASLYTELVPEPVEKPDGPPSKGITVTFASADPGCYHLTRKTGEVRQRRTILDRPFIVEDQVISFDWKETGRTATDAITGLPTREATAIHPDGDTLLVQYTPSITLPYGPEEYQGLPGMIVHLQKGKVTFQLQELEFLDQAPLMPLPNAEGKSMSREKYIALRERKEKALMDSFKGKRSTTVIAN